VAGSKVAIRRLTSTLQVPSAGAAGVFGAAEGSVDEGGLGRLGRDELRLDLVFDFFTGSMPDGFSWEGPGVCSFSCSPLPGLLDPPKRVGEGGLLGVCRRVERN